MKQFEKVAQSVEALAEFLSSENKGDNEGCPGCTEFEVCTGHETCLQGWLEFLNSEVEEPTKDEGESHSADDEAMFPESVKERLQAQNDRINKVALDLLQRCKDENLSIWEFYQVLEKMVSRMEHSVTMRDQPRL